MDEYLFSISKSPKLLLVSSSFLLCASLEWCFDVWQPKFEHLFFCLIQLVLVFLSRFVTLNHQQVSRQHTPNKHVIKLKIKLLSSVLKWLLMNGFVLFWNACFARTTLLQPQQDACFPLWLTFCTNTALLTLLFAFTSFSSCLWPMTEDTFILVSFLHPRASTLLCNPEPIC